MHVPFVESNSWPLKAVDVGMNLNKGPFGGHHLGGDSCPPLTFEVGVGQN